MLYKHKLVEKDNMLLISNELEIDPCFVCGGESSPRLCMRCRPNGKAHHHGRIHSEKHGLIALCNNCDPN